MRVVLVILLAILVVGFVGVSFLGSGPDIDEASVLVLELSGEFEETPAIDTVSAYFGRGPAIPTLLLQFEKAAADARIQAIVLHIRPLALGYARIQELRDAIIRTREAGTPVHALLDIASFNATREIYLASAADTIHAVPGYLGPFAGIAGQYLHLGGFLEKLGIAVEFERIGEFKSAPEMFAERKMSAPAREMMNDLLDGVFSQIVQGVAEGRGVEASRVREWIDQAPSTADELVEAGLADGLAHRKNILDALELGDAEEVSYKDYVRVDPRDLGLRDGPEIALIFGDGTIESGGRQRGLKRGTFASDSIVEALQDAADDDDIAAIVLRINSGGGSALASEQIWDQVRRIREEKPVVISMAEAAASGGYYVASAADAIVAEPATLTGSIGVFFLRPVVAGMYQKLDIGTEVMTRGRNASIAGTDQPLTAAQRKRASTFVRSIYDTFLERVATGRGTSTETVDRLGRGRVWLGTHALANGLVDELGGLYTAVQRAKKEAGIDPDADPARVIFPGPRSLGDQLNEVLRGDWVSWSAERVLPFKVPSIWSLTSLPQEGEVAYLTPYWIEIR